MGSKIKVIVGNKGITILSKIFWEAFQIENGKAFSLRKQYQSVQLLNDGQMSE